MIVYENNNVNINAKINFYYLKNKKKIYISFIFQKFIKIFNLNKYFILN